jgi:hypothetical protein
MPQGRFPHELGRYYCHVCLRADREIQARFRKRKWEILKAVVIFLFGMASLFSFRGIAVTQEEFLTWLAFSLTGGAMVWLIEVGWDCIKSPYLIHNELSIKRTRLLKNNLTLQERLTPKLEVAYKHGEDDHIVRGLDGRARRQIIRLRITNKGRGQPIHGIKVKAERFLNFGEVPIYGTPLQVSHDYDNTKIKGFTLGPEDRELIDVVVKSDRGFGVHLCHARGQRFLGATNQKDFIVTVMVTADTAPRQEISLWISDEDDLLHCEVISKGRGDH